MCLKSKYKRIKNYFFILLFFFLYNNLFSLDDVTLQLRWDHQFQFAGYYAALWQGYYEDAGLNVTIKSALSEDGQILSATREVSEGSAQFGVGAADILVANDQGADLVVSAVIFQQSASAFYALDETIMVQPINLNVRD